MTTEPLSSVASTEERCCLNERDIPATQEFQLVGGGTACKAPADDQCGFHSSDNSTSVTEWSGAFSDRLTQRLLWLLEIKS
jgi:hypothetical protein